MNKAKSLNRQEISAYKNMLFFLIIVDMFAVYWWLGLKKLGIASMFVFLVFLAFILFLERDLPLEKKKMIQPKKEDKKMQEQKTEETNDEVQESQGSNFDMGFDTGLPNAEDYNKRASEALGTL